MTSDFFADLERQLADATRERPRRLRRARARRAATLIGPVAAAGAGIAIVLGTATGDDARRAAPAAPAPAPLPATTRRVPVTPTAPGPTVAVLNGTAIPGLARGVANRLQTARYRIGNVTNAAQQDHATTTVWFADPADVAAAGRIAQQLDLPDPALHVMTSAIRTLAGGDADVVVLVGSDQDRAPVHHR